MTGDEFVQVEKQRRADIAEIETEIDRLRDLVEVPPINRLRPATSADVTVGRVFYYNAYMPDRYWRVVAKVLGPNDAYKAYMAADGSRDGLHHAWVDTARD